MVAVEGRNKLIEKKNELMEELKKIEELELPDVKEKSAKKKRAEKIERDAEEN